MNVPAGWYPDQEEPQLKLRYWDGQTWTEQYRSYTDSDRTRAASKRRNILLGNSFFPLALAFLCYLPLLTGWSPNTPDAKLYFSFFLMLVMVPAMAIGAFWSLTASCVGIVVTIKSPKRTPYIYLFSFPIVFIFGLIWFSA